MKSKYFNEKQIREHMEDYKVTREEAVRIMDESYENYLCEQENVNTK